MLKDEIFLTISSRYKPTTIKMHSNVYLQLIQELGVWTALDGSFANLNQKLFGLNLEITDSIEGFEIY